MNASGDPIVVAPFDPAEIRVIGCLIEKQVTTPEYYPLTLNALITACNQTTNRDPVMSLDEGTVERALENLRQWGLVSTIMGSRARRYQHRFNEKFKLAGHETAVMCVLMLRGPQTVGEIRGRTGRLHEFTDVQEVETVLESLMKREPPLATKLPRFPGAKEARFAHLLGGEVVLEGKEVPPGAEPAIAVAHSGNERIAKLEIEIEAIRRELEELRQQFMDLKSQSAGANSREENEDRRE